MVAGKRWPVIIHERWPRGGRIRSIKSGRHVLPLPPPPFLEVLILEGLKCDFSEVLILVDFKPFMEREIRAVLEVLILEGLKFDFSEVLILGGLRATNFEL
jgi:hypothetical protein